MKAIVLLSKVFFSAHPNAGTLTDFRQKVESGEKIHTIRANYDYWCKKLNTLSDKGGNLCIRQWKDKPYRSPQEEIMTVSSDIAHIQQLQFTKHVNINSGHTFTALVDGKEVPISLLAKNDGFGNDWINFVKWFDTLFIAADVDEHIVCLPHDVTLNFAIIHFTKFSY